MLVLSRRLGESILIGDNIRITTVRIGPNTVRYGIEAPKEMNIVREELLKKDADDGSGEQASGIEPYRAVGIGVGSSAAATVRKQSAARNSAEV